MKLRGWLRSSTMLSGVVGCLAFPMVAVEAQDFSVFMPRAASLPAVDGVNWSAEALGGSTSQRSLVAGRGTVTLPLSWSTGLTLSGVGGSLDRDALLEGSAHWFWRNPSRGLIGLYGSHTYWDKNGGVYVTHIAPEVEGYWGRWTVRAVAGVEFGNSATTGPVTSIVVNSAAQPPPFGAPGVMTTSTYSFTYEVKTRFFDEFDIRYYFTDNWMGYVGHRYLGGKHQLALGTEWALPTNGRALWSAFIEARYGASEAQGAWGGIKVYFGQHNKTLIRRHREDDPAPWDTLFTIVNSMSQSSSSGKTQFCQPGDALGPFGCENPS